MAESQTNALEVSVSELSGKLKRTVEETFGNVRVRGEISGFRGAHSSGHCYFSLKDERAQIDAIIWRGQASKLVHKPEEGLEVIATGKLTTYPGRSKYQIVIDHIEPAGAGALMALLEQRKKQLAAEGLFADERKRPIPFMPRVIGVVTSPTGAVIRDILHRVADRFPVHVIVWPVRVQGDTCGREVANGVFQLNKMGTDGSAWPRPDVIIVARGGGSLEDLWGFNDEALVRSVAASDIPVISAVGHETDWTLVDYAADMRAPTPTAAAEKAVPVKADLEAHLANLSARLRAAAGRVADTRRTALRAAMRGLPNLDSLLALPRRAFDEAAAGHERALVQRVQHARARHDAMAAQLKPLLLDRRVQTARTALDMRGERHGRALLSATATARLRFSERAARLSPVALARPLRAARRDFDARSQRLRVDAIAARITTGTRDIERAQVRIMRSTNALLERARATESRAGRMLDSLSYRSVLKRGYAVIRDADDRLLDSASALKKGTGITIEMGDGRAGAMVMDGDGGRAKKPKAAPKPDMPQGDLF